MGIEGACANAYFDALAACVPADVTFDGAADAYPATCPTPPCPKGAPSSWPNVSARCTPPGSDYPSASRAPAPTSDPAWRWTS